MRYLIVLLLFLSFESFSLGGLVDSCGFSSIRSCKQRAKECLSGEGWGQFWFKSKEELKQKYYKFINLCKAKQKEKDREESIRLQVIKELGI